jgi:DNA polymerase (family X)
MKLPKYLKMVGSNVRGKDKPEDYDLLAIDKSLDDVLKYFQKHNKVKVLKHGDKFLSLKMHSKQYDIWYTTKKDLPFAFLAFAYPRQFNIAIRKKAQSMGYLLNQYGLFKGDRKLPIKTIKAVFKKLQIPYRTPKAEEKKLSGGGIKEYIFKTAANAYRKRFCDGKARPLLDGEFHPGCNNFCGQSGLQSYSH